jgi:hypothetical protein
MSEHTGFGWMLLVLMPLRKTRTTCWGSRWLGDEFGGRGSWRELDGEKVIRYETSLLC